jgi:hypothetical protein
MEELQEQDFHKQISIDSLLGSITVSLMHSGREKSKSSNEDDYIVFIVNADE